MKEEPPNNNVQEVTASAARQGIREQIKNAQANIVKAVRSSEDKPK